MTFYNQVTGGDSKLVLYPESSFKELGKNPKGLVLPIISETFKAGSNKSTKNTITGKRGAGKPTTEAATPSGGMEMAANVYATGHILRALCGAPVSTAVAGVSIPNGSVADAGDGCISITCPGHGFKQDAAVSFVNITGYTDSYLLEEGTNENTLVVRAPFVVTNFTDATVHRGRVGHLTGDAIQRGAKVALSCPLHGLQTGDLITISGSTNYDGNHVVHADSSANTVVIEAAFKSEKFTDAVILPRFFKHSFKLPKRQPTVLIEREMGFDKGAADQPCEQFAGTAISGLNMSFGGTGQFTLSVSCFPSQYRKAATVIDDDPLRLPEVDFRNAEAAVYSGTDRLGDIESASLSAEFGVSGKPALGTRGSIARVAYGRPNVSSSLKVFLVDDAMQKMSDAETQLNFAYAVFAHSGEELWVHTPETVLDTDSAAIDGPDGLMQDFTAMAYIDSNDALIEYTLINRMENY